DLRPPTAGEKNQISMAMSMWMNPFGHPICFNATMWGGSLLNDPGFRVWDNPIMRFDEAEGVWRLLGGDTHSYSSTGESHVHVWSGLIEDYGSKETARVMFHEAIHAIDAADDGLHFTESEVRMLVNYCLTNEPNW